MGQYSLKDVYRYVQNAGERVDGATSKFWKSSKVIEVEISRTKYLEFAKHIEGAIAVGQPDILTINRGDDR